MMVINNLFDLGDNVYLITDGEQLPRIVTSIIVCPTGYLYELSQGKDTSRHYDFEISKEENAVLKTK